MGHSVHGRKRGIPAPSPAYTGVSTENIPLPPFLSPHVETLGRLWGHHTGLGLLMSYPLARTSPCDIRTPQDKLSPSFRDQSVQRPRISPGMEGAVPPHLFPYFDPEVCLI